MIAAPQERMLFQSEGLGLKAMQSGWPDGFGR